MTNASLSIFVLILNHLLDTEDGEAALGLASVILSCAQRGSFRRGFFAEAFWRHRFLRIGSTTNIFSVYFELVPVLT